MGVTTGKGFVFGAKEGNPGRLHSNSLDVYVTGVSVYNGPVRDAELIVIPGRNGALYKDNGRFENVDITYHCGMYADTQQNFATKVQKFRDSFALYGIGYSYLYDDYNPDEFRIAAYKGGFDLDPVAMSTAGEFDITFSCKPQRYLKSGDSTSSITSGDHITNPTSWASQPLISFQTSTGSGTITLTQNGGAHPTQTITLSGAPTNEVIYIDCEVGECYKYSGNTIVSLNNYVSFGSNIPVLYAGTTYITYTNTVNTVKITPRWWKI